MTHHTDAERALSSLRHLYQQMANGIVKDSAQAKRIADGLLSPAIAKLEQAARRAPAAPVPQGWKPVPVEPTDEMLAATSWPGCAKTDYAHMLAAAPQPPEAAPVQMPEPAYFLRTIYDAGATRIWFDTKPDVDATPVYTEQQVRELLAAHGIGAPSC